jgi:exo-beta-1,3-glucanase (GH17 family)
VELKGSELTSAQVHKSIDYVEACVRAGTYNATTIANLVDPPAMEAIDTLMSTSDMMRNHPTAQWQTE